MTTRPAKLLRGALMLHCVGFLLCAAEASAQGYVADFGTPSLDSNLEVDHEIYFDGIFYGDYQPGTAPHWSVTSGLGLLNVVLEPTDQPYLSQGPRVKTVSTYAGDFVAEITVDLSAANGSFASILMKAPDPWSTSSLVWAGFSVSHGYVGFLRKDAVFYGEYAGPVVTFDLRLSRIGQSILAEYRPAGEGEYQLLVDTADSFLGGLADPVWFELRNYASGITDGSAVSFSDFTITPVPEPSTYGMVAGVLALVFAVRRKRRSA